MTKLVDMTASLTEEGADYIVLYALKVATEELAEKLRQDALAIIK